MNLVNEKQFQAVVVQLARHHGWSVYHTYDSRRSSPGFPDLVLAHPTHGVLFRELKTAKGRLTPPQVEWLNLLQGTVWRPHHLADSTITTELKGSTPRSIHSQRRSDSGS